MTTRNRIKRLEKKLSINKGKVPRHDMVQHVDSGDPKYMEKAAEIRKRIFRKYGTTDGLIIIYSAIPNVARLPDFLQKQVDKQRSEQEEKRKSEAQESDT
jgi:hypothetical protein